METVLVKLTQHGRDLLKIAGRTDIREAEDGWSKLILWDLMSEFGQHIYMGCIPPFETTIRIDVSTTT
jgi:hypothetical protein